MVNRLYESRDGRYWIEPKENGYYKVRLGHVTCTIPYSNDQEAVASVKRARASDSRKLRRI